MTSSTSPLRTSLVMSDDARQLKRERDELQILLDKFEHHMSEVVQTSKIKIFIFFYIKF